MSGEQKTGPYVVTWEDKDGKKFQREFRYWMEVCGFMRGLLIGGALGVAVFDVSAFG